MTRIMGIINVTPDSYYDGGRYATAEKAIAHGKQLLAEGADILDIGGESTRPFADPTPEEEELRRILPVIEGLAGLAPLSIDSRRPGVARAAIAAGATLLSDVTGFRDPEMIAVAAASGVEVCCMHMLGEPKTMQKNPYYARGVVVEVRDYLASQAEKLVAAGIAREKIILDPGIGFGKSVEDNFSIIRNLPYFRELGYRVLIGTSRKTFLRETIGRPADEALSATIAVNTIALMAGVDILRVHDVREHKEMLLVAAGVDGLC